jgi:gliding motility-associated-like protein
MSNSLHTTLRKLFPVFLFLCCITTTTAQLMEVADGATDPYTPESLIRDVFLGDGVDVKSVSFSGNAKAIGVFNNGLAATGIQRGLVMTTGFVVSDPANSVIGCELVGSQFASSANGSIASYGPLSDLVPGATTNDVAYITITFCPYSDTLRFRYCFASEEYPEYGCSRYNDVFGFFISGPGYAAPTNIALIPGTGLSVAINNIHPVNPAIANCSAFNEQHYVDNLGTQLQPVYDGRTNVFEAIAVLRPCQQYTIRLAIADVSDARWDSGVFLEAKSFGTGTLKVEVESPPASATMAEGCDSLYVLATLPEPAKTETTVAFNVRGVATNGVDYCAVVNGVAGPFPSSIRFQPGQDTVRIPIFAKRDNLSEGRETILIDYQKNACRRDTIRAFIVENIMKEPRLRPDTVLCTGTPPLSLNGNVGVTVPPPPSFTNQQDVNLTFPFTTYSSSLNVSGIVPTRLGPGMITSVCINIDHGWTDDLDIFLVAPNGQQIELTSDNGGQGDNYRNTCFSPTATRSITAGTAPFTGQYLPETPLTDLYGVSVNGNWTLRMRDDALGQSGTLRDWTINFAPTYTINYQWSPPTGLSCTDCPVTTANPTTTTTYMVKVEDTYGCEERDTVKIEVKESLKAPTITCDAPDLSSVTIRWTDVANATGLEINTGSGWRAAPTGNFITFGNLAPSTPITVQVRGIGGPAECPPLVASRTCANCADIGATAVPRAVSCVGSSDGSFVITPDGKLPPYQYKFGTETNATGQFTGVKAGNYMYTVIDGAGCEKPFNISIPAPDTLKITIISKDISCAGGTDGSIIATATGGTGLKGYSWSFSSQTGSVLNNLGRGTYTVTVRDINGCTVTATATIREPQAIEISPLPTEPLCFDQPSGSIGLTLSGGTLPYRFAWQNGASTAALTNVKAGTYTVTIRDNNNCTKSQTIQLRQPSMIMPGVTGSNVSCFNSTNGTASAAPTGGTGAYTYSWSNGATTASLNNLSPANYIVVVRDANGCTETGLAVITAPPAITTNMAFTQVSCFGGNNGTATVTPDGGAGGFTYSWSGGQNTPIASNLSAGTFTVTVRDANACTQTADIQITQPSEIKAAVLSKDVRCFGENSGSVELSVKGGVQPYAYAWSNNSTAQNIANAVAGVYVVTVRDANNCTQEYRDTVSQPPAIETALKIDSVLCAGNPQGKIKLTVTGGNPGGTQYAIQWTGAGGFNSTSPELENLFAGTYFLSVTDNKGCRKIEEVFVPEPAELALRLASVADTVCFRSADGIATVIPAGGTLPYRYAWNTGNSAASATGLKVGEYEVTVTDRNNCALSAKTEIYQKAEVFALATFENPNCRNGKDGTATASSVFYGPDPADPAAFRYAWSTTPAQTTRTAINLSANGNYTVTVTDKDGCSTTRDVRLGNRDTLIVQIPEVQHVKCFGDANGSARIAGFGGVPPYSYFWNVNAPGQSDSIVSGLLAGDYRVTLTDAKKCAVISSMTIRQPQAVSTRFTVQNVNCFNGSDGAVTALPAGGTVPYQYLWQDGQTVQRVVQQKAGRVALTITDANQCTFTAVAEIDQPALPLDGTAEGKNASCFGAANGSILIKANGGTPPYRYVVTNGELNGSPLQIGLKAGDYIPRIVDANGCTSELRNVSIGQRPPVKVDLGPDIVIDLGKDTALLATVNEGMAPYSFAWRKADAQWLSCTDCDAPEVQKLFYTHDFIVEVTDSMGCIGTDDIRVEVRKIRGVYVAEGFTPNADGNNDILMVHGWEDVKILSFRVYDRWGELLYENSNFETNQPTIGWDGTFRGSPNDPGVYVWTVEAEYLDGSREVVKGHSVLIR